jgi:hypothetical protein
MRRRWPGLAGIEAAVDRVVAIVAHHEEAAGRHGVDAGVRRRRVRPPNVGQVAAAVRQGLGDLVDHDRIAIGAVLDARGDWPLGDRLAVDAQHAADHLDAVSRKAHKALDDVGAAVAGLLEHHDVAARGFVAEQATLAQRRAERRRMAADSIGELGDQDVVADQQGRLHRGRGDRERLAQHRAGHQHDGHDDGEGLGAVDQAMGPAGLVVGVVHGCSPHPSEDEDAGRSLAK